MRRFYTAESVTEGHPDKVCDQIADAILDECLRYDPSSRVACEVLATRGNVFVAGEITSGYEPPVFDVIRKVLEECGYCTDGIEMDTFVHQQSPDIAKAVSVSKEFRDNIGAKLRDRSRGAGDQGVMVGYACDDTPQLMPMPTVLAHRITRELSACRRSGYIKDIFSDGKAQVTVEYEDATTGNELEGAKLQVIDKDGTVLEEWISTKEEHVIYGLPEGSYTLHEELAPYEDGYVSASDVTFEVKEDGSVTKVEMKDEYSKVEISKTDISTGKELEGAKLQIIRKDGTVLEEWITDGKPHSVEKLPVNEELTLREITAPDGYEIAEDVTFTLKDTMEVQKVEMKDARTPEKTTEKTNAPKTGDNQKVWPFVLLALASAGTATGVTVYRRKKSKMTDNKEETEVK